MRAPGQPIELGGGGDQVPRLVQKLALDGKHLIGADDDASSREGHRKGLGFGQPARHCRRIAAFPQHFGLEATLVDLCWTRLESKPGPGQQGLSRRALGSKDQHAVGFPHCPCWLKSAGSGKTRRPISGPGSPRWDGILQQPGPGGPLTKA